MADENLTPTSSEQTPAVVATPQKPQAGTPETQAVDGGSETISLEEAKKLRSEAANLRKRLSGYEAAEKAAQEAALSEVEKAKGRADAAEQRIQQIQQQLVAAQVKLAAQGKGFINPDIAAKVVHDDLEFGDDGLPTNLDKALEALAKNNPFLLKPKAETPPEPTPAQTAPAPAVATPAIPAMNPGRNAIQPPNPIPQGPVRLSDVWKR